jgi:Tol biopolymer transport system component
MALSGASERGGGTVDRTFGRLMPFHVAVFFVLAAATSAHAVSINVGSAAGRPGAAVNLDVSLSAMGAQVAGTLNMIELPAGFSFIGCEVNPDIEKEQTAFSFQPVGCDAGEDCNGARAVVISFLNLDPIPSGSILYTCSVQILNEAADGEFPLGCSDAESSDPDGNALNTTCVSGAIAVSRAPECQRVSVRSDGGQANAGSSGPVVDATGRCVAFYSDASNLLAQASGADTNAFRDVFLFDRDTSEIQRVSVTESGAQANGPSQLQGFRPAIDSDCTCVAFSSDASNLVAGDTNGRSDVFVRDLVTPTTILASEGVGGPADGASSFPSVSADCERVAFQSIATNLVDGDTNRVSDIFVFDRSSGETTRISTGASGEANGASITPAISADGHCVAFATAATNLLPGDTNNQTDVYVSCDGAITCRASVSSSGREANAISFLPSLSADGRFVAFKSNASNLVPDDRNSQPDVFIHDCQTGVTRRASVNSLGQEGNDISIPPSISADGIRIAFGSFSSNLLAGQSTRGRSQVYVRDRETMATGLVSAAPNGSPANNSVPDVPPSISADGQWIAFSSLASDIVIGDTNQALDAFICAVIQPTQPVPPTATPTPTRTPGTASPTGTPTIPCTRDTDCPAGLVCDPVTMVCVEPPPCDTDDDCEPPATCIDGHCRISPTPGPSPTPLRTCMMDSECEEGEHCRAMVCVPIRECDDSDPEVDRVNCRGVRETCVGGVCECGGDCNLDGLVFGTEISRMVCIMGGEGQCSIAQCPAGDFSDPPDGEIMATEITLGVLNLGLGCPGEGAPLIFARDRTDELRTIDLANISGIPGQFVNLDLSTGLGGDVTTVQLDVLFDNSILRFTDPATSCTIAPRISSTHLPFAFLPQVPPTAPGITRLRLAALDLMFPLDAFTQGPVLSCRFRIQPTAGPGMSQLGSQRFEVGDPNGNAFGASVVGGQVTVGEPTECRTNADCPAGTLCGPGGMCIPAPECMNDADCPTGSRCGDNGVCELIPCEGDGDCPEGSICDPEDMVCVPEGMCTPQTVREDCLDRQACANGQCVCAGDCDGDGRVRGNDISIMINIINGNADFTSCLAGDSDGDGRIRGNDISVAINNINQGCPGE